MVIIKVCDHKLYKKINISVVQSLAYAINNMAGYLDFNILKIGCDDIHDHIIKTYNDKPDVVIFIYF